MRPTIRGVLTSEKQNGFLSFNPKKGAGQPRSLVSRPMSIQLAGRARDTQAFLRMAAIELRRMAERSPDVASQLDHIARQLEADADELAAKTSE